jgi:ferredoxin-NADP reductase
MGVSCRRGTLLGRVAKALGGFRWAAVPGRPPGHKVLLVVGGAEPAIVRVLCARLDESMVLLYRVSTQRDATFGDELLELAKRRRFTAHVLFGTPPTPGCRDPLLTGACLSQLVPDIRGRDIVVHGPAALAETVLAGLDELGSPRTRLRVDDPVR